MVNDVELFYETTGSGELLVLVHGSWGDARSWDSVVAPLAERFEVVALDRRGHSRSKDGVAPGSLRQDAEDLAALIEHLGGSRAHVVGNSFGGSVTLTLAAARPDLVASAAVHEPPLFAMLEDAEGDTGAELTAMDQAIAGVVELLEAGENAAGARQFVETVALGPGMWDRLGEAERETFVHNAPTWLDESRDQAGLSLDAAALAASRVPLLLTYGTESKAAFGAVVSELAIGAPAVEVRAIDGAGHVPQRTNPEALLAALFTFQDQLSRP